VIEFIHLFTPNPDRAAVQAVFKKHLANSES